MCNDYDSKFVMKRLNQEQPRWTCPSGYRTRTSTIGNEHSRKDYSHSLLIACRKINMSSPTRLPPSACVTWTDMNKLGCRRNSTCKLFNPEYQHQALANLGKTYCIGVTTMEWLDQGHLHPPPESDTSRPGIEPGPPWWEVSTLANSYSDQFF